MDDGAEGKKENEKGLLETFFPLLPIVGLAAAGAVGGKYSHENVEESYRRYLEEHNDRVLFFKKTKETLSEIPKITRDNFEKCKPILNAIYTKLGSSTFLGGEDGYPKVLFEHKILDLYISHKVAEAAPPTEPASLLSYMMGNALICGAIGVYLVKDYPLAKNTLNQIQSIGEVGYEYLLGDAESCPYDAELYPC